MYMLRREQFKDFFFETALPALDKVISDSQEEFPMEHETLFNIRNTKREIVQDSQVTGMPSFGVVAEGEEYPIDGGVQGYNKTYRIQKYGSLCAMTYEWMEDGNIEQYYKRAEQMGRSMRETIKISAASVLNDAFASAGPDGQPLISSAHPLAYPGAGTTSNTLVTPADMSLSSIQDLVTVMRKTRDNSGKKVLVRPEFLVVAPELEFLAHELLESEMKPQAGLGGGLTEENMVNALRGRYGLKPVVMDYLVDPDAFFLMAKKGSHEINWIWREQPNTDADYEFKSDVALYKIRARWDVGFSDFRGIAGSPGI